MLGERFDIGAARVRRHFKKEDKSIGIIILKDRQIGISALIQKDSIKYRIKQENDRKAN